MELDEDLLEDVIKYSLAAFVVIFLTLLVLLGLAAL